MPIPSIRTHRRDGVACELGVGGFPAAEAAQKQLARFAADPKVKKEIGAGRALAKLNATFDANKVSQRKKLVEALPAFIKKYEGTEAGKQAQEQLTRLQAAR